MKNLEPRLQLRIGPITAISTWLGSLTRRHSFGQPYVQYLQVFSVNWLIWKAYIGYTPTGLYTRQLPPTITATISLFNSHFRHPRAHGSTSCTFEVTYALYCNVFVGYWRGRDLRPLEHAPPNLYWIEWLTTVRNNPAAPKYHCASADVYLPPISYNGEFTAGISNKTTNTNRL